MSHRPGNVEHGIAEVSEPSRIVILAQHDQQASVEQIIEPMRGGSFAAVHKSPWFRAVSNPRFTAIRDLSLGCIQNHPFLWFLAVLGG
jgi:hypothetical protein